MMKVYVHIFLMALLFPTLSSCGGGSGDVRTLKDSDGDGVSDITDAFPNNPSETKDSDGDGWGNNRDNCPYVENRNQVDRNNDGIGRACDGDEDGILNGNDVFPEDPSEWADVDKDGVGDNADNCPTKNPKQNDLDSDGLGDVCDDDWDGDTFTNYNDNCPTNSNESQSDIDNDGRGDSCDDDIDGDGLQNSADNCQFVVNSEQLDLDSDGFGNACDEDIDNDGIFNEGDVFPYDPTEWSDSDSDGVGDNSDNCPSTANADQVDTNGDGLGDVCDRDGDGVLNKEDAFPDDPTEWSDSDSDGVGDNSDAFPEDPDEAYDSDKDGVGDNADNCPFASNADQVDIDSDGEGNVCDVDDDNDGVPDEDDAFPEDPDESGDCDGDGVGDSVDSDYCITHLETTPRAVIEGTLSSTPITVTLSFTGEVNPFAAWTKDRSSSPPQNASSPFYDDGTNGDKVAGDGIWSLTITDKENLPFLRLYDTSVDFFQIIVLATNKEGRVVYPKGNRPFYRYVAVVKELPSVAHTCFVGSAVCYSDWAINVQSDVFDVGETLQTVYDYFRDDFWGIAISWNGPTSDRDHNDYSIRVKNDVQGIGQELFAQETLYGVPVGQNLETITLHTSQDPVFRNFNSGVVRRWIVDYNDPNLDLTLGSGGDGFFGTSDVVGPLTKGLILKNIGGGCRQADTLGATGSGLIYFSDITLYGAGLVGEDVVSPHTFLVNKDLIVSSGDTLCEPDVVVYSIEDIVAFYGARVPSVEESRKEFPFGFVFITPEEPTEAEWILYKILPEYIASDKDSNGFVGGGIFNIIDPPSFSRATSGVTGEPTGSVVVVPPEPL